MAQVLSYFPAALTNVVHLELEASPKGRSLKDADDVEWLLLKAMSDQLGAEPPRAKAKRVSTIRHES
jgi:hypothetical protein